MLMGIAILFDELVKDPCLYAYIQGMIEASQCFRHTSRHTELATFNGPRCLVHWGPLINRASPHHPHRASCVKTPDLQEDLNLPEFIPLVAAKTVGDY